MVYDPFQSERPKEGNFENPQNKPLESNPEKLSEQKDQNLELPPKPAPEVLPSVPEQPAPVSPVLETPAPVEQPRVEPEKLVSPETEEKASQNAADAGEFFKAVETHTDAQEGYLSQGGQHE